MVGEELWVDVENSTQQGNSFGTEIFNLKDVAASMVVLWMNKLRSQLVCTMEISKEDAGFAGLLWFVCTDCEDCKLRSNLKSILLDVYEIMEALISRWSFVKTMNQRPVLPSRLVQLIGHLYRWTLHLRRFNSCIIVINNIFYLFLRHAESRTNFRRMVVAGCVLSRLFRIASTNWRSKTSNQRRRKHERCGVKGRIVTLCNTKR